MAGLFLRLIGRGHGLTSRGNEAEWKVDLEGQAGNIQHRNKVLPQTQPPANLIPPLQTRVL